MPLKAQEYMNNLIARSRPKKLGRRLASGVYRILVGAAGADGILVIAPVDGLSTGLDAGGQSGRAVRLVVWSMSVVVGRGGQWRSRVWSFPFFNKDRGKGR